MLKKVRGPVEKLTRDYAALFAAYFCLPAQVSAPALAEALLANPGQWRKVLMEYLGDVRAAARAARFQLHENAWKCADEPPEEPEEAKEYVDEGQEGPADSGSEEQADEIEPELPELPPAPKEQQPELIEDVSPAVLAFRH
jgi:hypothetical protein